MLNATSGPAGLSRRAFGGTIATAALALVAACGNAGDRATPAGTGAAAATGAGAGATAFPVSIENKYGTTEITAAPERIVVVGLTEQDALLALGVVPVATTEWFGGRAGAIQPWATTALGTATVPEVLSN